MKCLGFGGFGGVFCLVGVFSLGGCFGVFSFDSANQKDKCISILLIIITSLKVSLE